MTSVAINASHHVSICQKLVFGGIGKMKTNHLKEEKKADYKETIRNKRFEIFPPVHETFSFRTGEKPFILAKNSMAESKKYLPPHCLSYIIFNHSPWRKCYQFR